MKRMKATTKLIKRTVELLNGTKVLKSADRILAKPETKEEAEQMFGADLWKWAYHGANLHTQQVVRGKLGGGDSDGRSNKLLKSFRGFVTAQVDVLEMDKDAAVALAMSKEKFAPLKSYFEGLSDLSKRTFDFTSDPIPTPRWFTDESAEDEPDEENDEE